MTTTYTEHDPLHWVSINLEFGGVDFAPAAPLLRVTGTVDLSRLNRLPELVTFAHESPDLILFQEARSYDRAGGELLHYSERLLRRAGVGIYRGMLARSEHNDLHQVVFVNTVRIEVAHHWLGLDPNEGARRYGYTELVVDGDDARSIMAKSVHLDPRDGDLRLAQVKFLAGIIRGTQRGILAGDFNASISRRSARQGEPQRDFLAQDPLDRFDKGYWPPRQHWWWGRRRRRLGDTIADTRALDYLIDTGWTCQHIADNNTTPTIHPNVDRGGEIIIDRCLTRGGLRTVPGSVQVDTAAERRASDHTTVAGALTIEK